MKRSILLVLMLGLTACGGGDGSADTGTDAGDASAPDSSSGTCSSDAACDDGELNSLFDAVVALNLVDALQGPGPFTVFAPIDKAFDRAGASSLSKEQLGQILTFHVVPGEINEASLLDLARDSSVLRNRTVFARIRNYCHLFV